MREAPAHPQHAKPIPSARTMAAKTSDTGAFPPCACSRSSSSKPMTRRRARGGVRGRRRRRELLTSTARVRSRSRSAGSQAAEPSHRGDRASPSRQTTSRAARVHAPAVMGKLDLDAWIAKVRRSTPALDPRRRSRATSTTTTAPVKTDANGPSEIRARGTASSVPSVRRGGDAPIDRAAPRRASATTIVPLAPRRASSSR